jgi:hypothetical protein
MTQTTKKQRWAAVGWWTVWGLTFTVSLIPPIIHHWRRIPEIIEPFRYPWFPRLLPADLLFLREFGELSHWIPGVLLVILFIAIRQPEARNPLITLGSLATAVVSSLYVGLCLAILSTYLVSYSNIMEGKHDLIQWTYPKHSPKQKPAEQAGADQPATKPADKPPVKGQPSTPTPKDGPR